MVYQYLLKIKKEKGCAFLALLDPDKCRKQDAAKIGLALHQAGADAVLFGTSLLMSNKIDDTIKALKQHFKQPVIIFPGSAYQVSQFADAILYLSLVSGRNADLLIGEQVKAAPMLKASGLEVIPTGYMLIESGKLTSANYMSHTMPIPRDKADIAMAHALAAKMLGMKLIYMDAGSGAQQSIPEAMISGVAQYAELPVVVGGGIRTPEDAQAKAKAGATAVVIGNILEKKANLKSASEFARAIHFRAKAK